MTDKDEIVIEINLGRLAPVLLAGILLAIFFLPRQANARNNELPQVSGTNPMIFQGSYYLTKRLYNGSDADKACTAGYRMATLWDLLDPSNLVYDISRGYVHSPGDEGNGPPSGEEGWIRTGGVPSIGNGAGNGNCGLWSFAAADHYGTVAQLPNDWHTIEIKMGIWLTGDQECTTTQRVWCYRPPQLLFLPVVMK